MSVWRGRPPVLAGGISDSNRAHCASVRSLGNPLPDCLCASRCSLVHIPNHVLPILAETVNHAAVDNSRTFGSGSESPLRCIWIQSYAFGSANLHDQSLRVLRRGARVNHSSRV